jgi:signal peptidase
MKHLKPMLIAVIAVTAKALLSALKPGGAMAYVAPSACWALIALAVLIFSGFQSPKNWYVKSITLTSAAVAVAQIFILIDVGLFTGFGKSPVSFTPQSIALNIFYVASGLIGLEFSRAYLMKSLGRKRPLLTLGIVALLFTFIDTSITGFLNIFKHGDPLKTADYMGSVFLPKISENILASYLAFLGGPISSIAYRAPLEAFRWFVPVLPDLTWGFKALLGVVPPMMGFVYVNQAVTARDLRRIGIKINARNLIGRRARSERNSLLGWSTVSVTGILMVWFSSGLLGAYPTIPLSGSMRPALEVGDLAILVKTPPKKIDVGDIIHFWREEEMVIHRVYEIRTEGETLFITKGDANRAPDSDPILPSQIRGKLIYTIPKLGWASIYLKDGFVRAWTLISKDLKLAYGSLATLASGASIHALRARGRKKRHWRRAGW